MKIIIGLILIAVTFWALLGYVNGNPKIPRPKWVNELFFTLVLLLGMLVGITMIIVEVFPPPHWEQLPSDPKASIN